MYINLKVNSECQTGNNAFINCGHCITDCRYSLGYTVLIWVTTPRSLTCNYQLLNATSAPTTEAAYLLCCLLPMNHKDPSTRLWLNTTVGRLVLTAFCMFSLTPSIEKCQYSTLKQVTDVSIQIFLNSSLSDPNGQYDTNMNYTAEKVSFHPNQKLADVCEFVCDYRRNTCS